MTSKEPNLDGAVFPPSGELMFKYRVMGRVKGRSSRLRAQQRQKTWGTHKGLSQDLRGPMYERQL